MTPLDALATISRDAARIRMRLSMDGRLRPDTVDDPVPLAICPACRDALLHDLDRMFVPTMGQHSRGLAGAHVMGCTFSDGPVETCALHPFLRVDVLPRLKSRDSQDRGLTPETE